MKIAVVFPGQGSQSPGMLAELAEHHGVVQQTFEQASQLLDYDLWDLSQNGSEDTLKQTDITQPLMFVAGIAVWRLWSELGLPQPAYMAGHSLGEYTALTAAGVFNFDDALKLVALRGKLMASAVPSGLGGMAALLGMDDAAATALCESLTSESGVVEAVNFNSPGQVVISGHVAALDNACLVARENGARKAMLLPVSVPNHSSLMRPVEQPLAEAIDATANAAAGYPVVQNLTARPAEDTDEQMALLKRHVTSPVYWTDTVRYFSVQGVTAVVELGPGKVLAGLCKRTDKKLASLPVESLASLQKAKDALLTEHS